MFSLTRMTSYLLAVIVTLNAINATSVPDPCLIHRKCSTTEDIVYAVDDHQCYLFRNPCIYDTAICQRRENKESELKTVTKEECKEKCHNYCTEELFPVCTEYNSSLETFSNKCEFLRTSCQNDKCKYYEKRAQQVNLPIHEDNFHS
uniref:Kazal-like domain-containing protein n=1 Tax=Stomoxys calcitrans TaxID=35570 RepID=A0A1I8P339_STOCA